MYCKKCFCAQNTRYVMLMTMNGNNLVNIIAVKRQVTRFLTFALLLSFWNLLKFSEAQIPAAR